MLQVEPEEEDHLPILARVRTQDVPKTLKTMDEILLMIRLMTQMMTTSVHPHHTDADVVVVFIQKDHAHVRSVDRYIRQDDVQINATVKVVAYTVVRSTICPGTVQHFP